MIKIESQSPKSALCNVCLNIALWFCRRRWKVWKVYDNDDDNYDDDGQQTYFDQKSSLEPLAQVNLNRTKDNAQLRFMKSRPTK